MQITILGLGNSVLTDDAVGLRAVARVQELLPTIALPAEVSVAIRTNEAGGWEVLDDVEGADALIMADAILDEALKPGEFCWYPDKVFSSPRMTGVHNMDVFTAMDFARRHGVKMPQEIHVLGVGVGDVVTFSETCTAPVEKAIPAIADEIIRRLMELSESVR